MARSKLRVTTESGSVYHLDFDKLTWSREQSAKSGPLRTEKGTFDFAILKVGISMHLLVDPAPDTPPDHVRLITTSPVAEIEAA